MLHNYCVKCVHDYRKLILVVVSCLAVAVTTQTDWPSHSLHMPHTRHVLQVGDAKRCTQASLKLMEKHQIYVQDINYPTVARGEEKLRIAPTPFHTPEMHDKFVDALVDTWEELDLPFTRIEKGCSYYSNYTHLSNQLDYNLAIVSPAMA